MQNISAVIKFALQMLHCWISINYGSALSYRGLFHTLFSVVSSSSATLIIISLLMVTLKLILQAHSHWHCLYFPFFFGFFIVKLPSINKCFWSILLTSYPVAGNWHELANPILEESCANTFHILSRLSIHWRSCDTLGWYRLCIEQDCESSRVQCTAPARFYPASSWHLFPVGIECG